MKHALSRIEYIPDKGSKAVDFFGRGATALVGPAVGFCVVIGREGDPLFRGQHVNFCNGGELFDRNDQDSFRSALSKR